jgi:DNA mismatch repair ATPase MutS
LFRDDVLFFQVGRFIELYQEDDREVAELLGLAAIGENRRGARWGFPLRLQESCRRRLVAAGRSVVLIAEGALWGKVKERFPVWREESIGPGESV